MDNTVVIKGARGTQHVKSTGVDKSSYKVPGATVDQLRNSKIGGSTKNLGHSISGASVADKR